MGNETYDKKLGVPSMEVMYKGYLLKVTDFAKSLKVTDFLSLTTLRFDGLMNKKYIQD